MMPRTLVDVLGMKEFSSQRVSRELTAFRKVDRIHWRKLPKTLRPEAANGSVSAITVDESLYDGSGAIWLAEL
jgi:hypothetical protein